MFLSYRVIRKQAWNGIACLGYVNVCTMFLVHVQVYGRRKAQRYNVYDDVGCISNGDVRERSC